MISFSKKATVIFILFLLAGFIVILKLNFGQTNNPAACTMEAKICPDGTAVGRVGPKCEFAPCPNAKNKSDLIKIETPLPNMEIASPLKISGLARGPWFFEGSFPVILVDWDGRIIAQGIAKAQGEWMTTAFVPFIASLEFIRPDISVSNRGALILRKDNPSGLPQNDNALEIPVFFK